MRTTDSSTEQPATLDADEVAAHLGDADIVRAEGRMFPVETVYLGNMSMTAAISKALRKPRRATAQAAST